MHAECVSAAAVATSHDAVARALREAGLSDPLKRGAEAEGVAQDCTASKWPGWDSNPGLFPPRPHAMPLPAVLMGDQGSYQGSVCPVMSAVGAWGGMTRVTGHVLIPLSPSLEGRVPCPSLPLRPPSGEALSG